MTKVDDLETYILDGKEYLRTYSIRKLHAKVKDLGFTKYACEEVLKRFRVQTKKQTVQTPKKNQGQKSAHFIDDPNELLMSDAIRELNKEKPDVRWATILVNILKETKQLEAVNKDREEVQSKLKQYSTEDLVKLRKKLTGNLQIDG